MGPPRKSYPKSVVINGDTWDIKFKRTIENGKTAGVCDPSTMEIHISMDQSKENRFATLLHEILHAAEYSFGFDIPHKIIYQLEEALFQLFTEFKK